MDTVLPSVFLSGYTFLIDTMPPFFAASAALFRPPTISRSSVASFCGAPASLTCGSRPRTHAHGIHHRLACGAPVHQPAWTVTLIALPSYLQAKCYSLCGTDMPRDCSRLTRSSAIWGLTRRTASTCEGSKGRNRFRILIRSVHRLFFEELTMKFIQLLSWKRRMVAVAVSPWWHLRCGCGGFACLGTEHTGACDSSAGEGWARRADSCWTEKGSTRLYLE